MSSSNAVSWQDFITTQLLQSSSGSSSIAQAMILSRQDGTLWAATPNMCPRKYEGAVTLEDGSEEMQMIDERTNLVELVKTGQKGPQGLRLNGEKYIVTRTLPEPFTVYGKGPGGGLVMTCTTEVIMIGFWEAEKGHTAGGCAILVEKLGDYLREQGI